MISKSIESSLGVMTPGSQTVLGSQAAPGLVHSQGRFTPGAGSIPEQGSLPGQVHSRGVPGPRASRPRNCSNPF